MAVMHGKQSVCNVGNAGVEAWDAPLGTQQCSALVLRFKDAAMALGG